MKKSKKIHNIEFKQYRFWTNSNIVIFYKQVEKIGKIFLSKRYLELLEEYKIDLTDKYIKGNYLDDNFRERN